MIIGVEGIDPSAPPDKASPDVGAKLLFPRYEIKADVPTSGLTKDIEVPAEAVKGMTPPKVTGGPIIP